MAAQAPDVLTDPVGVIAGLVTGIEPTLDRAAIEGRPHLGPAH